MIKFEATGTIWQIEFFDQEIDQKTGSEIEKFVEKYEMLFSRFREDSLLFRLNLKKRIENPPEKFVELLRLGLEISEITNNEFSIFVGGKLERLGYGNLPKELLSKNENLTPNIFFSPSGLEIPQSVILDLGAFAKGFIVDELARFLDDKGFRNYLINAGGDIFVRSEIEREIYLEDPKDSSKFLKKIKINNAAICSSSNQKRVWKDREGASQKHIITNQKDILATFVVSKKCFVADLASTVLFISGDKYVNQLRKKFDFKFLIYNFQGKIESDVEIIFPKK